VEVKIELQKQHQRRINRVERVDYLMDEGSFEENKIHQND
jgi:acetyl-CoA carboxylase beta subunit